MQLVQNKMIFDAFLNNQLRFNLCRFGSIQNQKSNRVRFGPIPDCVHVLKKKSMNYARGWDLFKQRV